MRARGHIQLMLTAGRKWLRKIYFEKIVAKTAFGKEMLFSQCYLKKACLKHQWPVL
jgi:hypothetical protein